MRHAAPFGFCLYMFLLLCNGSLVWAQENAGLTYTIAILPVAPASEVRRRWQPLLDQISHETQLQLRFRFYEDFGSFENGLANDDPDFVVMAPLQAWRFRQYYRPLLRNSQAFPGIVVVSKNSGIKQLADLRGRRLALQNSARLATSQLILQALKEQKINPDFLYMKTDINALRSVALGKAEAAAVSIYALKLVPDYIANNLRIIHQTRDLPAPPFSASLRLPTEIQQKAKKALLHMQQVHPQLLEATLMSNIVDAELDRDYGTLGKLLPEGTGNESH